MKYRIVIWVTPDKDKYYYKKIKGRSCKYYVGYKNQYSHEVILIIDVHKDFYKKEKNDRFFGNRNFYR